jgi:iron complex transport system ATP-binding protein
MLVADNIRFDIKEKTILAPLSLTAKPGQLLGVLGPNGAGKSTLVKLLSGENRISAGRIWWQGKALDTYRGPELARERAVLTQHIQMSYNFPVEAVVMMGRYPHFRYHPEKDDRAAAQAAMRHTGIAHLAQRYYLTLSGGERQRVQMARVLAQVWPEAHRQQPKLLLLDEPLNNLDIRYQHEVMEIVKEFMQHGHVAIAVLHDLNLASMYADQLLLLHEGYKMGAGAPEEVLEASLLEQCYEFPVSVQSHPFRSCPYVFFGRSQDQHTAKRNQYQSTISMNT